MINMKTLRKLAKQGLSLIGLVDEPIVLETAVGPVAPLIQRLNPPTMPCGLSSWEEVEFVLDVIRTVGNGRFAKKISKKTLGKITGHYGVRVPGFRVLSAKRANMLLVPQSA